MKLNIKAFAVACALIWGLGLFVLTWWIIAFEGATDEEFFLTMLYRGYSLTPVGSLIGLVWGLIDGFIGGAIFAWLYNVMSDKISSRAR